MVSDVNASICLFKDPEYYGTVIYRLEEDGAITTAARSDALFPLREGMRCVLLRRFEDEDPELRYTDVHEFYHLLSLKRTDDGEWIVDSMLYNRASHAIEFFLSEDEHFMRVADMACPYIWWPVEVDLSLSTYDLSADHLRRVRAGRRLCVRGFQSFRLPDRLGKSKKTAPPTNERHCSIGPYTGMVLSSLFSMVASTLSCWAARYSKNFGATFGNMA